MIRWRCGDPREAFTPPADTDRYLLVADDTGLPAVAVILENLPAGVSAHVVAEVDSPAEQQELPASDSIVVEWVYRSGREPGVDRQPMLDAVQAVPPPTRRPTCGERARAAPSPPSDGTCVASSGSAASR